MPHLSKGLIVSCQAETDDPFNQPDLLKLFAKAAEMGGAVAVRAEGVTNIDTIMKSVNLPVIGLIKSNYCDGSVRITRGLTEVERLIEIGCKIIAVDGTNRHHEGYCGPEFISMVKQRHKCQVVADIATFEDAIECEKADADYIATTLNGYTPDTTLDNNAKPNYELIKNLLDTVSTPVIAEGRISTPIQAKKIMDLGVHAIVVGTAITRPRVITRNFVTFINK